MRSPPCKPKWCRQQQMSLLIVSPSSQFGKEFLTQEHSHHRQQQSSILSILSVFFFFFFSWHFALGSLFSLNNSTGSYSADNDFPPPSWLTGRVCLGDKLQATMQPLNRLRKSPASFFPSAICESTCHFSHATCPWRKQNEMVLKRFLLHILVDLGQSVCWQSFTVALLHVNSRWQKKVYHNLLYVAMCI